jgi:hypothetical protein
MVRYQVPLPVSLAVNKYYYHVEIRVHKAYRSFFPYIRKPSYAFKKFFLSLKSKLFAFFASFLLLKLTRTKIARNTNLSYRKGSTLKSDYTAYRYLYSTYSAEAAS